MRTTLLTPRSDRTIYLALIPVAMIGAGFAVGLSAKPAPPKPAPVAVVAKPVEPPPPAPPPEPAVIKVRTFLVPLAAPLPSSPPIEAPPPPPVPEAAAPPPKVRERYVSRRVAACERRGRRMVKTESGWRCRA